MRKILIFTIFLIGFLDVEVYASQLESVKVVRVIDGDTIEIEGGEKVRYIGINTPELNLRKNKKPDCLAKEALLRNEELVKDKVISLEKDVSNTDDYDRLLRYVYVDNVRINDLLVKEGYAKKMIIKDKKYATQIIEAEEEAKKNNLGVWSKCKNKKTDGSKSDHYKNEYDSLIVYLKKLIYEELSQLIVNM